MAGQRLVDGPQDLDELAPHPITATCPACHGEFSVDAVQLVRGVPSTSSSAMRGEIGGDRLATIAREIGVALEHFDGVPYLRGSNGLTVYVAPVDCPSCRDLLDVVLSWGEFQPGRWQLFLDGVVTGPVP